MLKAHIAYSNMRHTKEEKAMYGDQPTAAKTNTANSVPLHHGKGWQSPGPIGA